MFGLFSPLVDLTKYKLLIRWPGNSMVRPGYNNDLAFQKDVAAPGLVDRSEINQYLYNFHLCTPAPPTTQQLMLSPSKTNQASSSCNSSFRPVFFQSHSIRHPWICALPWYTIQSLIPSCKLKSPPVGLWIFSLSPTPSIAYQPFWSNSKDLSSPEVTESSMSS